MASAHLQMCTAMATGEFQTLPMALEGSPRPVQRWVVPAPPRHWSALCLSRFSFLGVWNQVPTAICEGRPHIPTRLGDVGLFYYRRSGW